MSEQNTKRTFSYDFSLFQIVLLFWMIKLLSRSTRKFGIQEEKMLFKTGLTTINAEH